MIPPRTVVERRWIQVPESKWEPLARGYWIVRYFGCDEFVVPTDAGEVALSDFMPAHVLEKA